MMTSVRVRSRGNGAVELLLADGDPRAVRAALGTAGAVQVVGRRLLAEHGVAIRLLEGAVDGLVDLDWDPAATAAVRGRQRVAQTWSAQLALRDALRRRGVELAATLLDARLRPVLDAHQLVDVALMTAPDGYGTCVFDEQGTGKTVSVIAAFDVLVERGLARQLLIVAPKSMLAEWRRDITRFTGDTYSVEVVSSTSRRGPRWSEADILVVGFETAVSREAELSAVARRGRGRTVLVIDESYHAKNREAARSRAISRIRDWCGRAFVLCGTPAPNAPHDVVHQFDLVDFGLTFDGVNVPRDRAAARSVVADAMEARGIFVRALKADVLPDLPHKRFSRVLVDFEPTQRAAYEAALQGLILDLDKIDDSTFARQIPSFLARRSALLQLCANPSAVIDGYTELPAKLRALDEIVQTEVVGRGEKAVIWSFYRKSLDAICERYAEIGLVRFDGTVTSIEERRDAVRRFQEDDGIRLFVGNPAAAGAGLTLHRARLAVYESLSNQAAHFLQSVDRIHRRGQEREVELFVLLCKESIEIAEFDTLERKAQAQRELLGDSDEPPVTRETMLHELLDARRLLAQGDR